MRVDPNLIVKEFKDNLSVSQTAFSLGIHRSTVYRWIKRARTYRNQLVTGFKRHSTKPKLIHYKVNPTLKEQIVKLKANKGYTAIKIKAKLNLALSTTTIHKLLLKEGLIRVGGYHRRPKFQNTTHMHAGNTSKVGYLQMDVKYVTPELSGLTWTCFEYAVIDIYSRYKEAVILNHLDEDGAMSALLEILPKLPFKPMFIQTDNGLEFQNRFHQLALKLGLKHHFIHKNTPNENALIERSFRTDEEEFFFRTERRPIHYDELRLWLGNYLKEYNYERPHLGINLKTPYEVVKLSQMSV